MNGKDQMTCIHKLLKQTRWDKETLADCLGVSLESIGIWEQSEAGMEEKVKKHVEALLSLFQQGREVFDNTDDFNRWLTAENFYFDGKQPLLYLKTMEGIIYTSSRLTGMEYGDNA